MKKLTERANDTYSEQTHIYYVSEQSRSRYMSTADQRTFSNSHNQSLVETWPLKGARYMNNMNHKEICYKDGGSGTNWQHCIWREGRTIANLYTQ